MVVSETCCNFVVLLTNKIITNMTNKIMKHLMENNSYFKWSNKRLAEKYGVSERTIYNVVQKLEKVKFQYLRNLSK